MPMSSLPSARPSRVPKSPKSPKTSSRGAGKNARWTSAPNQDSSRVKRLPHLTKYPRADVVHIKLTFDKYDSDCDGRLSLSELCAALKLWRTSEQAVYAHFDTQSEFEQRQAACGLALGSTTGYLSPESFLSDWVDSSFARIERSCGGGPIAFVDVLLGFYPSMTKLEAARLLQYTGPSHINASRQRAPPPEAPGQSDELSTASVRALFRLYDTNRNGRLSLPEILTAFGSCGFDDDELRALFEGADLDGSGGLDPDEFVALMQGSGTPSRGVAASA